MPAGNPVSTLMHARACALGWYHAVLGMEPSAEWAEWVFSRGSLDVLELFASGSDDRDASFGVLRDCLERFGAESSDGLEGLRDDYNRLFVGPASLPISHWESTYAKNDNALFQESTLSVRRAYVAEGYLPAGYPHVADDHVAIELDFLAALGKKAARSYDEGDAKEALRLIRVSRKFLDEHLLRWVPAYSARGRATRGSAGLYPEAIGWLERFLFADAIALDELQRALS